MSRRKAKSPHANHERWLVSYADFITLLFAFFVVLYSSSQVDHRKVGKLAQAIQVAFQELGVFQTAAASPLADGTPMPFNTVQVLENSRRASGMGLPSRTKTEVSGNAEDLAALRQDLEKALANEIADKSVALRAVPDGLVISLREMGFFDSGSAAVRQASLPTLNRIATLLAVRNYRIRIEGHTDDRPIHNSRFSDNWELSTARAAEVVRLLIVHFQFAPSRLSAAGFAQYHPLASNDTAENRAQNRRVDIVILGILRSPSEAVGTAPATLFPGTPTADPPVPLAPTVPTQP